MLFSPNGSQRPDRPNEPPGKAIAPLREALVWPQRQRYRKRCGVGGIGRFWLPAPVLFAGAPAARGAGAFARGQTPIETAQGLERNFDNALAGAVHGFLVRRRNRRVPGWRRRSRRRNLAFLQGLAGLLSAAGLRAAGDDAHPRHRRRAARRVLQGAPPLSPDPGGSKAGHQRVPCRRRQEFLRTRRHRLLRHGARGGSVRPELRFQPSSAGRVHHHPAGREELPFDQRSLVRAQDQGSLAGDAHRARLFEGPHPRTLSQRNLSRPRRLRHRRRLAGLLRQVGERTHDCGSRVPRRDAEGAGRAAPGA